MRSAAAFPLAVLVAAGASVPGRLPAQERAWKLELTPRAEVLASFERQDSESSEAIDRKYRRERLEGRLGLEAQGYLGRPDLLRLDVGGEFGLRRQWVDTQDLELGSDQGRLFSYDGLLEMFSDLPVSLKLFGNRFEDRILRDFGADREVVGETQGASASFHNRFFPSILTARRVASLSETLEPAGNRRDEVREIFEFSGSHQSELTRGRLQLRHEDVDDRSIPAIGDYRIREAFGTVSRNWGRYLEHYLRGSARFSRRTGSLERETTTADSSYRWDVTEFLISSVRYRFNRFENRGRDTTSQFMGFDVGHQLYGSLRSQLRMSAERISQDNGVRKILLGGARFDYTKRAAWNSRVRSHFRFERQINDNDLSSNFVPVVGEQLSIESVINNFLENLRVVQSTIVVMDAAGSPFAEGIDYEVVLIGLRTSIEILPSGDIEVGDLVVVDYEYETSPSLEFRKDRIGYGLGWDLGWLLMSYRHSQTREDLIGGEDGEFLDDSDLDTYRVALRRGTGPVRAFGEAIFEQERSRTIDRDEWRLTQSLLWPISPRLLMSIDLIEQFIDFETPERKTDNLGGDVSLTWKFGRRQRVRFFARVRSLEDSIAEDQFRVTIGTRARLRYGRIRLSPVLEWSLRDRESTRVADLRGVLSIGWSP